MCSYHFTEGCGHATTAEKQKIAAKKEAESKYISKHSKVFV